VTAAGSAGTPRDGFRVPEQTGRHRAPPTVPTPRTVTGLAVAAAVLAAASLSALAATAAAPDATATGVRGAAVTTTPRTTATAGPLAMPSVGVVAPVVQEMHGTPEPVATRSEPLHASRNRGDVKTVAPAPVRPAQGSSAASTPLLAATTEPTVTKTRPIAAATTPTTTPTATPDAPPSTATETSATTEETPVPTETVTPTVEPTPTPEPVGVAATSEVAAP
jgi:hypothetical protein